MIFFFTNFTWNSIHELKEETVVFLLINVHHPGFTVMLNEIGKLAFDSVFRRNETIQKSAFE